MRLIGGEVEATRATYRTRDVGPRARRSDPLPVAGPP